MRNKDSESAARSSGEGARDTAAQKRSPQFFSIKDDDEQEEPEQKCARIQRAPTIAWEGAGYGIYMPVVASATSEEQMATKVGGEALASHAQSTTTPSTTGPTRVLTRNTEDETGVVAPSIADGTDLSFMMAHNLRDTEEIDRRVAAAGLPHPRKAEQQHNIDCDRDMATALQLSLEEPRKESPGFETAKGDNNDNGNVCEQIDIGRRAIAVRMIFDNSDEEAFEQQDEQHEAEVEEEWFPEEGGNNVSKELLNATDFAIASNKRKLEDRKAKSNAKRIKSEAIELLGRQPELLQVQADVEVQPDQMEIDWADKEQPHLSHTMVRMNGGRDVLYCSVCSYWLKNKRLTASLRQPCEALKRSNWSKLRMLQCGVMPGPGARLPPSMARAKGTARSSTGVTGRRCTPINPNV